MTDKKWKIDPISLFSHELKTPLSSLKMGLNLLEKDFEKHKDILYLMKDEVEKMIDFITDNLDLRFIQNKKDLFQWEWISFEPILSQACSSLKLMAQEENISFQIKEIEGENFELFVDSSWIARLLENLLSNAIQFSPKNSQIFIEYGLDEKKAFFCSIKDEGMGLSDNKKVFDLFYKSPWPSKKNIKNTGLGLSIVKAIVKAHGGNIKAFSKSQTPGTTFYFTLPQARLLKQSA